MRRPSGAWIDRMDVDVGERHLTGQLQAHHDHASNPQEQNVPRRGKHVGRIERFQLGCVPRPAERREWPQSRGEPSVEHILLLANMPAARATALGRLIGDIDVSTGLAVVDRQAVAPPELTRDAPRPDVLHPIQIHAAVVLGQDPHTPVAHRRRSPARQLVHAHEPLQRDERLDPLA